MKNPVVDRRILLERGVFVAPWSGRNNELVLLAVTAGRQLLGSTFVTIPNGADRAAAAERLWARLDEADPITDEARDGLRRRVMRKS